jgi:hypothetical protein
MFGLGWLWRDETGGWCGRRCLRSILGWAKGRARLKPQDADIFVPPSPMARAAALPLRGQGLGQRCRPAGPNGSQPYLSMVHITNGTASQARQKITPGSRTSHGLLAPYAHHGPLYGASSKSPCCRWKSACHSHTPRTRPDGTPGGGGRWLLVATTPMALETPVSSAFSPFPGHLRKAAQANAVSLREGNPDPASFAPGRWPGQQEGGTTNGSRRNGLQHDLDCGGRRHVLGGDQPSSRVPAIHGGGHPHGRGRRRSGHLDSDLRHVSRTGWRSESHLRPTSDRHCGSHG